MIGQGEFLCCRIALARLSVSKDPVWDKLSRISLLADFTATSALLLDLGLYAVVTL